MCYAFLNKTKSIEKDVQSVNFCKTTHAKKFQNAYIFSIELDYILQEIKPKQLNNFPTFKNKDVYQYEMFWNILYKVYRRAFSAQFSQ